MKQIIALVLMLVMLSTSVLAAGNTSNIVTKAVTAVTDGINTVLGVIGDIIVGDSDDSKGTGGVTSDGIKDGRVAQ